MATDTLLRSPQESTGGKGSRLKRGPSQVGASFPVPGSWSGVCAAMHTLLTRTVEKGVHTMDTPSYWRR